MFTDIGAHSEVSVLDDLKANPLPALLAWDDPALAYFVRRDLLGESVASVEGLWEAKEAIAAGEALKARLFRPDKHNDRKASPCWLKFQFPFLVVKPAHSPRHPVPAGL